MSVLHPVPSGPARRHRTTNGRSGQETTRASRVYGPGHTSPYCVRGTAGAPHLVLVKKVTQELIEQRVLYR